MRISLPQSGTWPTVRDYLIDRIGDADPARVDDLLASGDVATADGASVTPTTAYRGGRVVFVRRALKPEVVVPHDIPVIHEDERVLVVDKPPFLATMPRGAHITQTVVARLRDELGLPLLSPAHRLDRLTSGVLLLTKRPEFRGRYQQLFATGRTSKIYYALAAANERFTDPVDVDLHIVKHHGVLGAQVDETAPANSHTEVRIAQTIGDRAIYRLNPTTGRTHQLRATMNHLGMPIEGDPLYPVVRQVAPDDFSRPLQLLAATLEFVDPFDGEARRYESARRLPLSDADRESG